MRRVRVTVLNSTGFSIHNAADVVRATEKLDCDVTLDKGPKGDGEKASSRSILGMVGLYAPQGTELNIEARGPDEDKAIQTLLHLFESRFGEE